MEIKEAVHILTKAHNTPKGFYLNRDGNSLYCPKQQSNPVCGNWCPAFKIHVSKGTFEIHKSFDITCPDKICVELKCFPQYVSFDIQEATDDQI